MNAPAGPEDGIQARYPRTPYAPFSPSGTNMKITAEPQHFLDVPLVITEKLDGSNTRLHLGQAFPRSPDSNSRHPWLAMTRKHHAWKTAAAPDLHLYGEDIYGVHSVHYDPVAEDSTLYLFAASTQDIFAAWEQVEELAELYRILTVPVLHKGTFQNEAELRGLCLELVARQSALGPVREGVVIRRAQAFPAQEFHLNVCKAVRPNHVPPDQEHWSRHWRPCGLLQPAGT